jgi:UDP-N-acetylmuramoyl-L-alanyl-D-glutamate--2,6-diaminopimelate ligase
LVGITGTNGRLPSLLYYINYSKAGFKVGLISTVKILVDDIDKATHTTPDSITINHYLAEMRDSGLNIVLWKYSSKEQKHCIS